jgi:hypothetical protein
VEQIGTTISSVGQLVSTTRWRVFNQCILWDFSFGVKNLKINSCPKCPFSSFFSLKNLQQINVYQAWYQFFETRYVSHPDPTLFVGHIGEFFPPLFLEAILATQTNKLDGLAHVIIRVF